jgi:hypothetical protein
MEQTKWEEVLISWMSGKSFEFVEPRDEIEEVKGREDWQIVDLEALLLKRGLIPDIFHMIYCFDECRSNCFIV